MRLAATACTGSVCDAYIPLSLLLPLLVLAGAVASGGLAISAARRERTWLLVLGVCTAIAVIGPTIALLILRDSPDAFVVSSTILVALAPISTLAYTFSRHAR
jgi:hypothetical protein